MQTGTGRNAAVQGLSLLLSIAAASAGCTADIRPLIADTDAVESASAESPLFESAAQNRDRRAAHLSEALSRTLREFPGTASARVHLSLPNGSLLSSEPPAPPQAAVLIVPASGAAPAIQEIRRFVAASVPNLSPERVTVVLGESSPKASPLVQVGPFRASAESAQPLRVTLIILLTFCMIAAFGLIGAGLRIRKLRDTARNPFNAP